MIFDPMGAENYKENLACSAVGCVWKIYDSLGGHFIKNFDIAQFHSK